MPITKDLIKAEIDKVEEKHLETLYKIVKALEVSEPVDAEKFSWPHFINMTYGSMHDAPIERGDQGEYESRDPIL